MSMILLSDLILATGETLLMVFVSTFISILLGWPLGTLLYSTKHLKPQKSLHRILGLLINLSRSIPFIILMVAIIPLTRFIVGTSIGIWAAIVPLSLGATPFFARLVNNIYETLPQGLIETGHAMGANIKQIIWRILLPESLPALINVITVTAITLVNYSAMAGTVGGGGLGDLAIRYGYQRFNPGIMLATVAILVVIVQGLQWLGDYCVRRLTHS